ncbi:MAG TPA: hypothetical protein VK788_26800 [Terriglobales bacterium]|jgi:hypothetical protein|nr:hypothetical protein [Terriglobales bacterium]
MGHFDRLQFVGRISYYLGWISLLCGGLVQLHIGVALFTAISLTKRNLFEVSVVLFIICMASELRALALAGSQASAGAGKRVMAA